MTDTRAAYRAPTGRTATVPRPDGTISQGGHPSAAAARPGLADPDPAGTTRLVRAASRRPTRYGTTDPTDAIREAGG
jgi:hypothetical protein